MKRQMLFLGAVLLLLAGCSTPSSFYYRGVEPLNVNSDSESTPVSVRIYQLKEDTAFENATFENLWSNDVATLGDAKIGDPYEITVFHGDSKSDAKEYDLGILNGDTRFIGVIALYDGSEEGGKRKVIVPSGDVESYVFEFTGYRIVLKSN